MEAIKAHLGIPQVAKVVVVPVKITKVLPPVTLGQSGISLKSRAKFREIFKHLRSNANRESMGLTQGRNPIWRALFL